MGNDTEKGRYRSPEGSKTWEYLAIFTCSLMPFCIGMLVGWNSPSVVKLMTPDSPIPVTASDASTLAAMLPVGHTIAPPINNLVVDRIGRKNTILLSALPLIISWGMIMIATNVWVLYVARFIGGLALGLVVCVCPMYIGEVSSPATRGASGALITIGYNTGILVAYIIVPRLAIAPVAGIFLAVVLFFVIVFWFMPESPYFLAMRNRLEESEEVLEKLRGKPDVTEELETIMASMSNPEKANDEKASNKSSWKDIFTVPGNRRAFIVILAYTVTHHFGGFFTILGYGQLIFQASNSTVSDYTANTAVGVTQVISSFVMTFLVDKLGRRPLTFLSGLISGLCNLAIGSYFYAMEYLDLEVSDFSLVPFVASMIMVFAFNCGLLSLQIIMLSEIFGTEVKAIGTTLIGVIGGFLGTVSTKLYLVVAVSWDYGHSLPFLAFSAVAWICTIIILYYAPETKGKTLAQIQKELSERR